MSNLIFISFYTKDTIYEKAINNYLIPSLQKFDLPYYTWGIENQGTWAKNTINKPLIILEAMRKFKEDICWMDADAIINEYPELLFKLANDDKYKEIDIGVCYLSYEEHYGRPSDKGKFELIDGTIFIRNNDKMKKFITQWKENSYDKGINHQKVLERMLEKRRADINIYNLPRDYCYIVTTPKGKPPAKPLGRPVISHYQLSRDAKKSLK